MSYRDFFAAQPRRSCFVVFAVALYIRFGSLLIRSTGRLVTTTAIP